MQKIEITTKTLRIRGNSLKPFMCIQNISLDCTFLNSNSLNANTVIIMRFRQMTLNVRYFHTNDESHGE